MRDGDLPAVWLSSINSDGNGGRGIGVEYQTVSVGGWRLAVGGWRLRGPDMLHPQPAAKLGAKMFVYRLTNAIGVWKGVRVCGMFSRSHTVCILLEYPVW